MMSNKRPQPEPATALLIEDGVCKYESRDGEIIEISGQALAHSKLLEDLVQSSDSGDRTTVPITADALQLWMNLVSRDVHRACELLQVSGLASVECTALQSTAIYSACVYTC